MAVANTTTTNALVEISPTSASLSTNLTSLQRSQLDATSGLPGSLGRPGSIQSDVSGSRTIDNTFASSLDVSAAIAGALETSGATTSTVRDFVQRTVSPTVINKRTIVDQPHDTALKLADRNVRLPDPKKLSVTEKMRNTRDSLVGRFDENYNGLAFPPDLVSRAPVYIVLHFHEYKRGAAFTKGNLSPGKKVFLPLPDNFQQVFNIQADSKDFGTAGAGAKFLMNNGGAEFLNSESIMGGIGNGLMFAGRTAFDGAKAVFDGRLRSESLATLQRNAGNLLSSVGAENADGLVSATTGLVPNPHPTAFFQGIPLRRFSWQWKFVPRSEQEASQLKAILGQIKERILPEEQGGFLKSPDYVQPLVEPNNKLEIKFKKCMITQFTINYSGEGTSAFFVDGSPVSIICGMEFTEMELFLRNDI